MVLVGDINNSADSSGYGAISYQYYIGRYEVTNSDYTEFLNAVAQTDSNGLYNNSMNSLSVGGITRTGSVGSYQYAAKTNMGNKPVNFVSWADCARYCNWLCNNKPSGAQTSSTTENGAYDMSQSNPSRNNNAVVFMPTENEWYKAAFYKGGSTSAGYWLYATQSNAAPNCVSVNISGDGIPV
jgi:formylglycine-generating enzyme required for sulfatase activity